MDTTETIHPTAVVDPKAQLGAGVRVGAHAVIGPQVTLDTDVEIGHGVILEGRVVIGRGARIGHGAVLGGLPQDLKFKEGTPSGVRIGGGTVVREYVTVHRATRAEHFTEIGSDCLLMTLSHVAHDCRVGNGVIIINYAGLTGHCEVGDHATIGGYCGMIPFTRVGAWAYVGGVSKVTQDIPPCMLADGNPATVHGVNVVGLRRGGVPPAERRAVREAHRILYRSGLAPHTAVERIRAELAATPYVTALVDFITSSRKGIAGAAAPAGGGEGEGDDGDA
ncbi:MAG: acyl-ACP--UDP-N-acetylglucosamine O-acyltransferase [Candidatus Rokubacteria bacterium]|nr:acyl-ACP--UDP-N-acetylglucosamine O-acyltransferase [Candidatus Rokubacteria bacterium]MBI3827757.1 acyl-ACP--UDP-N-acetylglucosamine O-acyltransferase [Candidatus Rokubacteria bacterium]